jgi:hypothetical protein
MAEKSHTCQVQHLSGRGARKLRSGLALHPPRTIAFAAIAVASLAQLPLAAERVNWLTGPALRKKLEARESIAWSGQPLRVALEGFSRSHKVALLIDRRVDPGQPLEASIANASLAELFTSVAANRGLGVSFFESVVYLGPPDTARRLRTVVQLRKEELSQLPTRPRLAWLQARAWSWQDFATPRELLQELAQEGKFEIQGLQRVPHDLWSGADLPPLGMAERLTLVLAQFDYTFRLDASAAIVQIEPMPEEVWLERTYAGGGKATELAEKLAALPGVTARVSDGKVVVRGLAEQHEQIVSGTVRAPQAAPVGEESLERKTFTLTATNQPVKTILESLQRQLGLELKIDAAAVRRAGRSLDMLVDVKVKDATLDETLKAVLTPAGLQFRRDGKVVAVAPAGEGEME